MSNSGEECGGAECDSVRREVLPPATTVARAQEQDDPAPTTLPNYTCNNPEECEKVVENVGDEAMSSRQEERPGLINNNNQEVIKNQAEAQFTIGAEEKKEKDDVLVYENSKTSKDSNSEADLGERISNLRVLKMPAKNLAKPTKSPTKSPSPRESVPPSPKRSPRGLLRPPSRPPSVAGSTSPGSSPRGKKPPTLPQGDNLKAILFAVDGTIADSDPLHFQAFQEALIGAGFNDGQPISQEYFISQMSGKLNTDIAHELLPEMDEVALQAFLNKKEARFRSLASTAEMKSVAGFHRFVKWVKQRGVKRAAVTNLPRETAEQLLHALGVIDFFDILVVGNECEHPKPHADPYLEAIKQLQVKPYQTFVLEDSPLGVRAAIAAGCPTVALLTGHPGPVLKSHRAALLIKDYNDPDLWANLGGSCGIPAQSMNKSPPPFETSTNDDFSSVPPCSEGCCLNIIQTFF